MLQYYFSLHQFRLIKLSVFIHTSTLYIHVHPRLGSRIEPKFSVCRMIVLSGLNIILVLLTLK